MLSIGISLTLYSLAPAWPAPAPAKLSLVTPPSLHHLLRPDPELGPEPEIGFYVLWIDFQKLVFSLIDVLDSVFADSARAYPYVTAEPR